MSQEKNNWKSDHNLVSRLQKLASDVSHIKNEINILRSSHLQQRVMLLEEDVRSIKEGLDSNEDERDDINSDIREIKEKIAGYTLPMYIITVIIVAASVAALTGVDISSVL